MKGDTEVVQLLRDIREYLHVLAEPMLLERQRRLVLATQSLVGKSEKKKAAVLLMDGSRTRSQISKASGLDQGDLSRLVKALMETKAITEELGNPRLLFSGGLLNE